MDPDRGHRLLNTMLLVFVLGMQSLQFGGVDTPDDLMFLTVLTVAMIIVTGYLIAMVIRRPEDVLAYLNAEEREVPA